MIRLEPDLVKYRRILFIGYMLVRVGTKGSFEMEEDRGNLHPNRGYKQAEKEVKDQLQNNLEFSWVICPYENSSSSFVKENYCWFTLHTDYVCIPSISKAALVW